MRLDLSRARRRLAERSSGADEAHETVVVPRTPSARRQKDSEAKRGLVAEQLRLGHEAFARGDYDIALQYGERAAFVDPDDAVAIELINKSRVAIDAKAVLPLLQEANRLLSQNRIQDALTKAEEASAGVPDLVEADGSAQASRGRLSTRYAKHGNARIVSIRLSNAPARLLIAERSTRRCGRSTKSSPLTRSSAGARARAACESPAASSTRARAGQTRCARSSRRGTSTG